MMVLSILVVLQLMSDALTRTLEGKMKYYYFQKYNYGTEDDFAAFIQNYTIKDMEELSPELVEWFNKTYEVMNWLMYVIIILAVAIFGTIMVKRVLKELR
jgi:small-conductance mechanosensitive channel